MISTASSPHIKMICWAGSETTEIYLWVLHSGKSLLPSRTESPKPRPSESHDFQNVLPHKQKWTDWWMLKALRPVGRVPQCFCSPPPVLYSVPYLPSPMLPTHVRFILRPRHLLPLGTHKLRLVEQVGTCLSGKLTVAGSSSQFTRREAFIVKVTQKQTTDPTTRLQLVFLSLSIALSTWENAWLL
jgi:hypothetical protein